MCILICSFNLAKAWEISQPKFQDKIVSYSCIIERLSVMIKKRYRSIVCAVGRIAMFKNWNHSSSLTNIRRNSCREGWQNSWWKSWKKRKLTKKIVITTKCNKTFLWRRLCCWRVNKKKTKSSERKQSYNEVETKI